MTNSMADPRASDEAKEHAREILSADGYQFERPEGVTEDEHQMRVNAGYKAALNSTSNAPLAAVPWMLTRPSLDPRVSDEAKLHAEEYLQQHGGF